jgi:hypothetical protein
MTRAEILASVPLLEPPGWALAERELFDLLDHAWRRFARDFTCPDGRLNYRHALTSRDGVDDFYEVFFNWPQLYLLGGADDLLAQAERHWEGVTAQLTELGMLNDLASYCTSCGGWEVWGLAGRSGGCWAGGFSVAGGSDILPWCAAAPGFAVGVAAA